MTASKSFGCLSRRVLSLSMLTGLASTSLGVPMQNHGLSKLPTSSIMSEITTALSKESDALSHYPSNSGTASVAIRSPEERTQAGASGLDLPMDWSKQPGRVEDLPDNFGPLLADILNSNPSSPTLSPISPAHGAVSADNPYALFARATKSSTMMQPAGSSHLNTFPPHEHSSALHQASASSIVQLHSGESASPSAVNLPQDKENARERVRSKADLNLPSDFHEFLSQLGKRRQGVHIPWPSHWKAEDIAAGKHARKLSQVRYYSRKARAGASLPRDEENTRELVYSPVDLPFDFDKVLLQIGKGQPGVRIPWPSHWKPEDIAAGKRERIVRRDRDARKKARARALASRTAIGLRAAEESARKGVQSHHVGLPSDFEGFLTQEAKGQSGVRNQWPSHWTTEEVDAVRHERARRQALDYSQKRKGNPQTRERVVAPTPEPKLLGNAKQDNKKQKRALQGGETSEAEPQ